MKNRYNKIKKLREECGITQAELAKAVFVTDNMISMIEKGVRKPSMDLLDRIAEYFGYDDGIEMLAN